MKKTFSILSLLLLIMLIVPSNIVFASTDDISYINIRPKHKVAAPGDDSLYYGYVSLNQGFNNDRLNYTASVKYSVSNVRIDVGKPDNVTVTGNTTYDLQVGENTINIGVTKPDGTSKTYTIVITRKESPDDNTDLSDLWVQDDMNNNYIESYDFDTTVTSYDIVVKNEVSEVSVGGEAAVDTSSVKPEDKKYKLKTGKNIIKVTVTSKTGKQKVYTINITRKLSSNTDLWGLSINGDELSAGNHKKKVLYDVKTVVIKATAEDETTKIKGTGKHKLKVGANVFKVTVTAENGKQVTYTLTVVRAKPTTELNDLLVNTWHCGTEHGKVSLKFGYGVTKAHIKAKPVDKSAKVTGNGTYKLKVGKNVFHLKVKAADGKVTTYTVTVNRSKKKHVVVVIIL